MAAAASYHLSLITYHSSLLMSVPTVTPAAPEEVVRGLAAAERAEHLRARLVECGLEGARLDEAGNCVALRRGRAERPLLVLSAHLDTVFPAGTDFTVRRDTSGRMHAPGIAEDGCGLAA